MLDEWIRGGKSDNEGKSHFSKKSVYIMVIAVCLGLLALIWPVTRTDDKNSGGQTIANNAAGKENKNINQELAAELEHILSRIDGAGKVEVSITLASGGIKTYAANTRSEKREIEESQNDVKKTTSENNTVRDLAVSAGAPLLVENKTPEVIGVLVVAEGAGSPLIREKLIQAAATLLNVSPHQVCVMPGQDK